jgi:hypothetical protein
MKILFFTHYFPPEVNAPASRTFEMCKRWVRAGHAVHVITGAPNAPDGVLYPGYKNRLSRTGTMDGIRVTRVWTFLAANKGTTLRMVNYLSYMVSAFLRSLFVARPDVIIATSPQLFCGFAGWLASIFRRTRLVLESRDMFAESITTLTSVQEGRLIRWIRKLEFFLYRRGDRLVTVGPGYKRKLVAGGVPEEHIAIAQENARSASLRGAVRSPRPVIASASGTGSARRSNLPPGVSGRRSRRITRAGMSTSGSTARSAASASASAKVALTTT